MVGRVTPVVALSSRPASGGAHPGAIGCAVPHKQITLCGGDQSFDSTVPRGDMQPGQVGPLAQHGYICRARFHVTPSSGQFQRKTKGHGASEPVNSTDDAPSAIRESNNVTQIEIDHHSPPQHQFYRRPHMSSRPENSAGPLSISHKQATCATWQTDPPCLTGPGIILRHFCRTLEPFPVGGGPRNISPRWVRAGAIVPLFCFRLRTRKEEE
jgi:hypothetical protein